MMRSRRNMMGSRKNVDRLSNMPEDVISHILSLMPTMYAVRTCVLSKSWVHSWKSVTNLVFDDKYPCHEKHYLIKFVDRVLECCKASQIQLFRLHCSKIWVGGSRVCEWIDAAVRLNVCELYIKVLYHVLPNSLFTCKTLTKLTIRTHGNSSNLSFVNLPCLKTIDIDVSWKVSVNALNLTRACPALESLSLEIFAFSEEDYNFNNPTLKHLKLIIKKHTMGIGNKVVLNVPKLEDLYVRTQISTVFVMEDLSSLISVTLSSYNRFNHLWVFEVLKGVSGAKTLTIDVPRNPDAPSDTPIPNFPYLKHLEFNTSSSYYGLNWALFHQILENSPELEHLRIIMNPKNEESSPWIEPQSVPTCMLNNLRTMKFANFKGPKSYMKFLAYLLGNAGVLTKLTIKCDSLPLDKEIWLRAKVLKLPRASRYCKIHFVGSQSYSITT